MALFEVKRYDGVEGKATGEAQYLSILKKLIEDSQARKIGVHSLTSKEKEKEVVITSRKKQKTNCEDVGSPEETEAAVKAVLIKGNDVEISGTGLSDYGIVKKKKDKAKLKLSNAEIEVNNSAKLLGTPKGKNLKRKTTDNSDSDSILKKVKTEMISDKEIKSEGSVLKRKIKSKKVISGETEGNISVDQSGVSGEPEMAIRKEEEKNNDGDEEESVAAEGPHEIGGFTILGDYKQQKQLKVHRVLPNWLAKPNIIKADVTEKGFPLSEIVGLDARLEAKLLENNISHLFPVQYQVIPTLLNDICTGMGVGCGGYRPRDICCSSPTGSGKTLSFVLPILQALKDRVVCRVRAVVVLPVGTLARQVYGVFHAYSKHLGLKVGLLMGHKNFEKEQKSLVKQRLHGFESLVDIVVSTPGKLVDHITSTEGFELCHLRFLVIDEADRVIEDIKNDWLSYVEKAVYSETYVRPKPGPITINNISKVSNPFQKLLFSATLSDNSEKLKQLNLFQPRLFLAAKDILNKLQAPVFEDNSKEPSNVENKAVVQSEVNEAIHSFVIPKSLKEMYVVCNPSKKVLVLLHLMIDRNYRSVVCFTNTIQSTHRLYLLTKIMKKFTVAEFSSNIKRVKKEQILSKFASGKISLLICTDSMARGMDLMNIDLVVSYDCPRFVETYVHRIGRTARAGHEGTSVSLLQIKEVAHFKDMRRQCGSKENYSRLRLTGEELGVHIPLLEEALTELPKVVKKIKNQNRLNNSATQKSPT